jgi:AcrR family transcriptional regulator
MQSNVIKPKKRSPQMSPLGQRGPIEHERREQILKAADKHFRRYGYNKTTVADLAQAIGLSTAYIYKFFESKQAIGEAICAVTLGRISAELRRVEGETRPAADRLRLVFQTLARLGAELLFNERELFDLAATACTENWQVVKDYSADIRKVIRDLIAQGRESGEFERKTPIEEACRAISHATEPFWNCSMQQVAAYRKFQTYCWPMCI